MTKIARESFDVTSPEMLIPGRTLNFDGSFGWFWYVPQLGQYSIELLTGVPHSLHSIKRLDTVQIVNFYYVITNLQRISEYHDFTKR